MEMRSVPDPDLDLAPIRPEDGRCFQDAMEGRGIKSHHYYFPRLLFGGRRQDRILLFEQFEGSVLLYNLQRRETNLRLSLYVPPFPFGLGALRRAVERMRGFNHDRSGRIDWVQDKDVPDLTGNGFSTRLRESEFIYDRAAVAAVAGPAFARVRRNLALLNRYDGLVVREYAPSDEAACRTLYSRFRAQLQAKEITPKGHSAMINCLKGAAGLPTSLMRGQVFEIDGIIRAYAFGGPIASDYGCVYVAVADHEFPGLAYALRHEMMKRFPELAFFNDSTDNKRVGLREMKQRFRPIEMHSIHGAKLARR